MIEECCKEMEAKVKKFGENGYINEQVVSLFDQRLGI